MLSSKTTAQLPENTSSVRILKLESQVTELQNKLLEKQGELDRVEADHRLLATREEKERETRISLERQLDEQSVGVLCPFVH